MKIVPRVGSVVSAAVGLMSAHTHALTSTQRRILDRAKQRMDRVVVGGDPKSLETLAVAGYLERDGCWQSGVNTGRDKFRVRADATW